MVKGTFYEQTEPVTYGILRLLALKCHFGTAGKQNMNRLNEQVISCLQGHAKLFCLSYVFLHTEEHTFFAAN